MANPTKLNTAHGHHAHAHDDHGGGHGGDGHDDHGGGGHCPPPWILTFADMAVLLMSFFVIMLMTAKQDEPKFNAFAAVMRETFGRAPIDPNDADRGGTSILDLHFGPQSGEPTNEPPGTKPESGDPKNPEDGAGQVEGGAAGMPDGVDEAAKALAQAMTDAVAQGELTVESDAGKVVVRLPSGTGPEAAQKIADAISEAANMAAQPAEGGTAPGEATGVAPEATASATGGSSDGGDDTGEAMGGDTSQLAAGNGTEGATGGAGAGNGRGIIRAKLAALQAGLLLETQIAEGSVDIEQRDGAIVVTVGAGGAFASGSADITPEAQAIIADLQQVAGKATKISVTGHTDNVPLSGSTYADNWELASARAATVLREIADSGLVPQAELVAQSRGETQPVADNSTPEGREKNRRIEIEIEFSEMKE